MDFIKNHKYLTFLIIFNCIVRTAAIVLANKFIHDDKGLVSVLCILIIPWWIILPMDAFYLSRRYPSKKKWISIISTVVVYLSFLLILDPGTQYHLGDEVNTGLYRFERIRYVLEVSPYFLIVINISYIAILDLGLRYLGNKIYRK